MKKQNIMDLLKDGFEPKIISVEFGIPLELINSYLLELQAKSKGKKATISRLDQIRKNYQILYEKKSKSTKKIIKPSKRSDDENNSVNKFLQELKDTFGESSTLSERKKINMAFDFSEKYRKNFSQLPLEFDELIQIYEYIFTSSADAFYRQHNNKFFIYLWNKAYSLMNQHIVDQVDYILNNTDDIEELKKIKGKLPKQQSSLLLSGIIMSIDNRIAEMMKNRKINELLNDISDNMKELLTIITSEVPDLEQMKSLIDIETQRRISKSNNIGQKHFALNYDDHRKQVCIQLNKLLKEKALEYRITNPYRTYDSLCQLGPGEDRIFFIDLVVSNLIDQNKKQLALDFCNEISKSSRKAISATEFDLRIQSIRRKIRSAEIGEIILKQINCSTPALPDEKFMDLLESKMKAYGVTPSNIILGKTEDGSKTIMLSHVWYDQDLTQYVGKKRKNAR